MPLNSKVSLHILDETTQEWYIDNCIATNETFLICDSNSEVTAQPKLVYLKSLNSSVTWKNKNKQDFETLEFETDDNSGKNPHHAEGGDINGSNYLGDIKFYLLFILILV